MKKLIIILFLCNLVFGAAGQILTDGGDVFEISTVYDQFEIGSIQYAQTDNVMYLVYHPTNPKNKYHYDFCFWDAKCTNDIENYLTNVHIFSKN